MPLNDPVPSKSFDVLTKNMEVADEFTNSTALIVENRPAPNGQAKTRTLAGINADASAAIVGLGWDNRGEFSTLPTMSDVNDVAVFEGNYWLTTEPLPYTPTGTDPTQAPELGKWLVAATSELLGIARSLNTQNNDVIYDNDQLSPIPNYIYSASQQIVYSVPSAALGSTITSVSNDVLNTTSGTYTLELASSSLQQVARSLNALDAQVILASTTTTSIQFVNYIYDESTQVVWIKPTAASAAGEVIVSIVGNILNTNISSYQMSVSRNANQVVIEVVAGNNISVDNSEPTRPVISADLPPQLNYSMSRINMHFGALKGIPWNQLESGGDVSYVVASPATVGDMSLALTSVTGLVADQLICYVGDDGDYYSSVIKDFSGLTINLRAPIEAIVSAGNSAHNFYDNFAHANTFGFYAIADYALRELSHSYKKLVEIKSTDWEDHLSSSIDLANVDSIYLPGSDSNQIASITTTGVAAFEGVQSLELELPEGMYLIRGYISPGTTGGGSAQNTIDLAVEQTTINTGTTSTVAQVVKTGENSSNVVELLYSAAQDSTQRILCRAVNAVAGVFAIGKVEIFRVDSTMPSLDGSRIVMLGDSWFEYGLIQDRLELKLPNAIIFNEGVGGNNAGQLLARFDTDVTPHDPDYVMVIAGTNDYFQLVSVDTFDFNMNSIKQKITDIGATPIYFDPSVGEIDNLTYPDNFELSRIYALWGTYAFSESYTPKEIHERKITSSYFVYRTIAAGATDLVYMPGLTTLGYSVIGSFFDSAACFVKAGYSGGLIAPTEDIQSYAADTLISGDSAPVVVPVPAGNRFISVAINNPTGAPITISGYIELDYTLR